jgi:hypothetical protein
VLVLVLEMEWDEGGPATVMAPKAIAIRLLSAEIRPAVSEDP